MKRVVALFLSLCCMMFLFAGCKQLSADNPDTSTSGQTEPSTNNTEPTTEETVGNAQLEQTDPPSSKLPEGTPLTTEELKWFEEKFFSAKQEFRNDKVIHNIRNMFLRPEYTSVEEIDLRLLFREGVGEVEYGTHEETVAVYALMFGDWPAENGYPVDVLRIPRQKMEEAFLENTGLTIDQTQKNGLADLEYLEEYDSYYDSHTDTAYSFYTMLEGVRLNDGTVALLYKDKISKPADEWLVTLKPYEDTYWFVSNLPC